jgi:ferrochelatase
MKTSVLLTNFGSPRNLEEVEPFLKSMMGKEPPVYVVEAAKERYKAIGGGSPLAAIAEKQTQLLSNLTDGRFTIKSAFRHSRPTIEEAIDECCNADANRIVFFVMSPFYSSKTTGSTVRAAKEYIERLPFKPRTVFVHSWYREPLFLQAWKSKIRREAADKKSFYLFTAHSLPQSLSEPYRNQIEETVESLARHLALTDNYALGWQSVPPYAEEPWIGPSVESLIDGVSQKVKRLIEVPIGFVSDHLETLYDMDIAHRHYAESKGLRFSRISSLNTDPLYMDALKNILLKSLEDDR